MEDADILREKETANDDPLAFTISRDGGSWTAPSVPSAAREMEGEAVTSSLPDSSPSSTVVSKDGGALGLNSLHATTRDEEKSTVLEVGSNHGGEAAPAKETLRMSTTTLNTKKR